MRAAVPPLSLLLLLLLLLPLPPTFTVAADGTGGGGNETEASPGKEVIGRDRSTGLCLRYSTASHQRGYFNVNGPNGTASAADTTTAAPPASGLSCPELKQHFELCDDPPPPRDCLLARVPWRTPLSVAKCCFSCCMRHWQRELGMEEVYLTMKNISLIASRMDPQRKSVRSRLLKGLPGLDSVVLQEGSARRFSVARMSPGQKKPWIMPHERLLRRGGVVALSDGAGLTQYISRNITEVVARYPVSIVNQGDIAWPQAMRQDAESFQARTGFSLLSLPGGGKTVTVNANAGVLAPNDNLLLSFWGVKSLQFESMLGDGSRADDRPNFFMCCCMTDRNGRAMRAVAMKKFGLCKDFGSHSAGEHQTKGGRITMQEYISRLASSNLVWSPAGHGLSTFRDLEVILAGAVPVLDGLPGRRELFEKKFRNLPVIWVPGNYCRSQHFCPAVNVTRAWLQDQWSRLMARREHLDVAEAFWPYWLYQLSSQISTSGGSSSSSNSNSNSNSNSSGPIATSGEAVVEKEENEIETTKESEIKPMTITTRTRAPTTSSPYPYPHGKGAGIA